MLYRVNLAIDNLRQSPVYGDDGAVVNFFGHAVACHANADGVDVFDFQGIEIAAGQADGLAGIFDDMGFGGAGRNGCFFIEMQFDIGWLDHPVRATDRLGIQGIAGLVGQSQFLGVFLTFAGFQPLAFNGQNSGDFFHTVFGHAAGVPVVNVLSLLDVQEIGKCRRRDFRLFEENLESFTAGFILFHKRESNVAGQGFESTSRSNIEGILRPDVRRNVGKLNKKKPKRMRVKRNVYGDL